MSFRCASAIALVVATLGCGADKTTGIGGKAADIVVDPTSVTLFQKDSARITPLVVDGAGTLLAGIPVTFVSSNAAVATVSKTGMVTSVGPAGSVTIAVRGAGLTKNVPVTVVAVPTSISVAPNPGVLAQKTTLQLDAKVLDLSGTAIAGAQVNFASSNTAVATVSATGVVTSVGPAGTVVITVSSGALTRTVPVAVTPVATSIRMTPSVLTLGRNSSGQITAVVLDAVGTPIANVAVAFTSSAPEVVTVSSAGQLTTTSALGSATITARLEQLSATATVTVVAAAHPAGTVVGSGNLSGFDAAITAAGDFYVTGYYGPSVRGKAPQFSTVTPIANVPFGLAVTTNGSGSLVFIGGSNGKIVAYDPAANQVRWESSAIAGVAFDLLLSDDESTLFVSTNAQKLTAVDASTGAVQFEMALPAVGVHLVLNPSRPVIYASGRETGNVITEIDLRTRTAVSVPVGSAPQGVAISPDGRELYIALESGGVQVMNTADHTSTTFTTPGCAGYGILLTPDTEQLWIACSQSGVIAVVDRQSRTVVKTIPAGTVRRLAITPDGSTLIAASEERYTIIR